MKSSLSATGFVKNNKRKVGVIVASLSIALAGLYLIAFFLNCVIATYGIVIMDNVENVILWYPSDNTLELNGCERCAELADLVAGLDGVKSSIYTQTMGLNIIGPVGNEYFSNPLFDDPADVEAYLDTIGGTLVEGRMPSEPGDIIISANTLKANHLNVGDGYLEEYYGQGFRIVGAIDYTGYGLVGLTNQYMNNGWAIVIQVDDIKDMNDFLSRNGITVYNPSSELGDYLAQEKLLNEDVINIAESANNAVFIGLTVLIAFAILVVFIGFIRDRQTEWCLYRSIGYSKSDVFLMVFKETLIIIGVSIVVGSVLAGVSAVVLNNSYINKLGYVGELWLPETFPKMLALLAAVLGVIQIPILYTIHNVGTIDKVED